VLAKRDDNAAAVAWLSFRRINAILKTVRRAHCAANVRTVNLDLAL